MRRTVTMSRTLLLSAAALAFLTLVASTAGACGWEQTCNTEEWLRGELAPYLP